MTWPNLKSRSTQLIRLRRSNFSGRRGYSRAASNSVVQRRATRCNMRSSASTVAGAPRETWRGYSRRAKPSSRRYAAVVKLFRTSALRAMRTFARQTQLTAFVKSFGRRQASESRRGTNPRSAGRGLWRFDVLVVPGWTVVKCSALDWMRTGSAFPGDHD
jgi:hypothetical protein